MTKEQRYKQYLKDRSNQTNTFYSEVILEGNYDDEMKYWNGKIMNDGKLYQPTNKTALILLYYFGLL